MSCLVIVGLTGSGRAVWQEEEEKRKISVLFLLCLVAARASHDSPRTPNVHISGPRRFKHHQNSTKGPPGERRKKERKKDNCGGRGKKSAKFRTSTLRGLHPTGPPPFRGRAQFGPPPASLQWPRDPGTPPCFVLLCFFHLDYCVFFF